MLRTTLSVIGISLAAALFAPARASASEWTAPPSLLVFRLPASTIGPPAPVPVASWAHAGCWTPRSGSGCLDVYSDGNGGLWICKACGTTGNPSKGKCRQTTQAELNSGLWCSVTPGPR